MSEKFKTPDMFLIEPSAYVDTILKDYESYRVAKDDVFPKSLQYLVEEILLKQCEFVNLKAAMNQATYDDEEEFSPIIKTVTEVRKVLRDVFASELGLEKKYTLLFEDARNIYGLAKNFREVYEKILTEEDGLSFLNWIIVNYQYSTYLVDILKEKIGGGALAAEIDFILEDFCKMMDDFSEKEVDRVITYFFDEKLH